MAVLVHNPDHEPDEDDSHGDQEKIRDPEVYAQSVLKQGLKVDASVVEHLFELLPDQRISRKIDDCEHAGSPPKAWASGVYRHGESQQPQRTEVELEPMEAFMHIRMTEEEWNTTSSRYGANHYIAGMVARWEHINPLDDDLNSVIPAAIAEDLERDWVQNPRMVFVDDEGEELHVGSMMAMTTARVPSFEPGGMSSDWIKACKVYNAVVNIEEMIVLWIHRRVVVYPVEPDGPRADGGDPPIPEMNFRGGIP
ncbi:GIP, partial [Symbiodinium necroappetens]